MNLEEVKMQDALSTASIEINDNNTYEYYFYPGIPHKIEAVRVSLIQMAGEKGKRIDKTLIELVYNE
ncbi:hypothetical protein LZ575_10510 [Antarcticibacterium sp. 1MA-6-2]|uniref:hypothetical protein n=1 Tax=Antarcticibacterium sp. 1MA-6-2 TaxID=2908210 RepID=UPI001F2C45A7|nr:hypothetical protein [Antarcticibacterium sp. 1MA-6-2]UJH92811.1 hypothetical protein LZ575_10510 [Antarcticibacterium sp. 1MA-6-2]